MSENKVNLLDFDRNALRAFFLPMNWAKKHFVPIRS